MARALALLSAVIVAVQFAEVAARVLVKTIRVVRGLTEVLYVTKLCCTVSTRFGHFYV